LLALFSLSWQTLASPFMDCKNMSSPGSALEHSQSQDDINQMTHGSQQNHPVMALSEHAMDPHDHSHCLCDCLCDFCGVSGLALLSNTLAGFSQTENRFNLTIPFKQTFSLEESLYRPPISA